MGRLKNYFFIHNKNNYKAIHVHFKPYFIILLMAYYYTCANCIHHLMNPYKATIKVSITYWILILVIIHLKMGYNNLI